jgi:hypothetical protein
MRKFCVNGIRESTRISPLSEQGRGLRFLLPASENGDHHEWVTPAVNDGDHA